MIGAAGAPSGGWRAGDLLTASRAGVSSLHSASGSMARAEMALNQDKSRLQLRSASPEKGRSFKFSAHSVSETSCGAYSPRSAAPVPGSTRASSPLRGLRAGEIMRVMRDRSPGSEGGSLAWPHQRGENPPQFPRSEVPTSRGSPKASPRTGGGSPANFQDEAQRLAAMAMAAAARAEDEAEVDVLHVGGVGRDGSTRPLSPRVRDSPWLDGLSPRTAERGGSRLFPTHLASASPVKSPGGKLGGAYPVGRPLGAREKDEPKEAKSVKEAKVTKAKSEPKAKLASPAKAKAKARPEGAAGANATQGLEEVVLREVTKAEVGLSKLQMLRNRLEKRMQAAEEGLQQTRQELHGTQ
ncbi:unnamed protein product [Effrenium voratum]|nr:unnamed protein product [Effrenium voratum]